MWYHKLTGIIYTSLDIIYMVILLMRTSIEINDKSHGIIYTIDVMRIS